MEGLDGGKSGGRRGMGSSEESTCGVAGKLRSWSYSSVGRAQC